MRILLISGSTRVGSTNAAVLRTAGLQAGGTVEVSWLEEIDELPLFGPDRDQEGVEPHPRVAWINAAGPAAPTGAADAHESLAKVLRYTGADVVAAGCARVPVTRDMVGADGQIVDAEARAAISLSVRALIDHARSDR